MSINDLPFHCLDLLNMSVEDIGNYIKYNNNRICYSRDGIVYVYKKIPGHKKKMFIPQGFWSNIHKYTYPEYICISEKFEEIQNNTSEKDEKLIVIVYRLQFEFMNQHYIQRNYPTFQHLSEIKESKNRIIRFFFENIDIKIPPNLPKAGANEQMSN